VAPDAADVPSALPADFRWRYFKAKEFNCHHCGKNHMNYAFVTLIDELRHRCGFPFIVTSGYRCPEYNQMVSTTGEDGPHTTGKAVDISVSHEQCTKVLEHALTMPFRGYGLNQKGNGRFIHIDCVLRSQRMIWTY
jgi:uncharacterized protein YcbK (DUF882 family)